MVAQERLKCIAIKFFTLINEDSGSLDTATAVEKAFSLVLSQLPGLKSAPNRANGLPKCIRYQNISLPIYTVNPTASPRGLPLT
jgi:hypothetical protein